MSKAEPGFEDLSSAICVATIMWPDSTHISRRRCMLLDIGQEGDTNKPNVDIDLGGKNAADTMGMEVP